MTASKVLSELKKLGTAQNRKVYTRHGASGEMFGVSYADLNKLQKKHKHDNELAQELWDSGIHDARILATMIADPDSMTAKQIDAWVKDIDNYVVVDAFAGLVAKTRYADNRMRRWMKARNEWRAAMGWCVLSILAAQEEQDPEYYDEFLEIIRTDIHEQANRVRHNMNMALISVGICVADRRDDVFAIADEIGKVEVDHGETSCKTPPARPYIEKALKSPRRRIRSS